MRVTIVIQKICISHIISLFRFTLEYLEQFKGPQPLNEVGLYYMKYKARVSKYSLSYCIILYCIASFEDLFKNLEPLESIDLQDDDHSNQLSRAKN